MTEFRFDGAGFAFNHVFFQDHACTEITSSAQDEHGRERFREHFPTFLDRAGCKTALREYFRANPEQHEYVLQVAEQAALDLYLTAHKNIANARTRRIVDMSRRMRLDLSPDVFDEVS